MELKDFHFAYPIFLWMLLAIPLIGLAIWLFYRTHHSLHQLEKFIDRHLLPYLMVQTEHSKHSRLTSWFLWAFAWTLLVLALAGPRWSFRELETFSKDQSLVILLDLSESMNATDIKPSRLTVAKQKIEDLIHHAQGVKMGLIAFAADPHVISPLTEDTKTLKHVLPSLDTELIYIQGSRLSPALEKAQQLLEAEPGHNKAILVISDGGYEDTLALKTAKSLSEKGIIIHTMGIGTTQGAPIKDSKGNIFKKNGNPVISKLERERFEEISRIGHGHFFLANPAGQEELILLTELEQRAEAQLAMGKTNRFWEEQFTIPLLMALPVVLIWLRQGALLASLLFITLAHANLHADTSDYFKNSEQQGKEALESGNYQAAIDKFQDAYRKGVACYKAAKYAEAEELFKQSTRPEVACQAKYNLGNALAQQLKLKEAIQAYEEVLKQKPDHIQAKENLELVKKLLEEQKQNPSSDQNDDQQKNDDDTSQNNKNSDAEHNDSKDQPPSQDNTSDNPSEEASNDQEQKDSHEDQSQSEDPSTDDSKDDPNANRDDSSEKEPQQDAVEENPSETSQENPAKTQEDFDADALLNRIADDPKTFMKNKFFIESKKNSTKEGVDPW